MDIEAFQGMYNTKLQVYNPNLLARTCDMFDSGWIPKYLGLGPFSQLFVRRRTKLSDVRRYIKIDTPAEWHLRFGGH